MAVIPIPFIISGNGPADSLFMTVGLWVVLFIVIMVFSVIYGLLKGEISVPRMEITAGKIIAAVLIASAGVVAFIIHPLLLLPLLAAVLFVLVYLEVNAMNPDHGPDYLDQDSVSRERYVRPKTDDDQVIDAEFRVVDEPVKDVKQARPMKAGSIPDAAGQRKAEDQRSLYEEQKKREQEQKLRAQELERQHYIHGLFADRYRKYLQEAERFRKEFGKNVQCDVCGRWDGELFVHRNQTYCAQCLPGGSRSEYDRTVVAGKHGASIDHVKK